MREDFVRNPGARVVLGGGGHAKVVIAAMEASGEPADAVLDDNAARWGSRLLGVPIVGGLSLLAAWPLVRAVIAIGNNVRRKQIAEAHPQVAWITVVHPSAIVHPSARIGAGAMIVWRAVVEPDAEVGAHAIVNSGAIVCHDAVVGAYAHVSVTSVMAGEARVDEGVFLGMNACVIGGVRVGAWSTVGAGASVVRNVAPRSVAVGVPARVIRSIDG
jgi:sugar O-acyltransferase (sialic acid O-acetyltransferase NeuD family)